MTPQKPPKHFLVQVFIHPFTHRFMQGFYLDLSTHITGTLGFRILPEETLIQKEESGIDPVTLQYIDDLLRHPSCSHP